MVGGDEDRRPSDAPIRVLLIEDDHQQAALLRAVLDEAEAAFVLDHADRLSSGLERLGRGGIDVVLLDLALPDSYGLETVRQTRAHAAAVPIVVLSGLDDRQIAEDALDQGAQDYLVKGEFGMQVLVECLRHVVRHYGAGQAGEHNGA